MRIALGALAVVLVACGSSAEFRPARGFRDLPTKKEIYRLPSVDTACEHIGFVIHAKSLESLEDAARSHGGTHYVITDDFGGETVETQTYGSATRFGNTAYGAIHSSSEVVKHHLYAADVLVCGAEH